MLETEIATAFRNGAAWMDEKIEYHTPSPREIAAAAAESYAACIEISEKVSRIYKSIIDQPDDDIRWYSLDFSIDTDEYRIDDTKHIKQGAD